MPVRFAVSLLNFDVILTVWMMHAGIVYCKPSLTNSSHGSVSISLVLVVGIESLRTLASSFAPITQRHYANKDVSLGQRMVTKWRERRTFSFESNFLCQLCHRACSHQPPRPVPPARPTCPARPPAATKTLIFNSQGWVCTPVLQRKKKMSEIFRKIPNLKGECLCVFSLLWIGCLTRSR